LANGGIGSPASRPPADAAMLLVLGEPFFFFMPRSLRMGVIAAPRPGLAQCPAPGYHR
jgi:hypothetical protein